MNTSDVILLGHYWDAEAVGALRVVLPAARPDMIVMGSFTLLFTPVAARLFARGDLRIGHLYWQTAAWIAVLSFPVFAVTFSLSQPLTIMLFGERYELGRSSAPRARVLLQRGSGLQRADVEGVQEGSIRPLISVRSRPDEPGAGLPPYPTLRRPGSSHRHELDPRRPQHPQAVGLKRGTGIGLFQREDAVVYVSIVADPVLVGAASDLADISPRGCRDARRRRVQPSGPASRRDLPRAPRFRIIGLILGR